MRRAFLPSLGLLLLSALSIGCGDSISSVTVSPTDARLVPTDTVRLSASALDKDGMLLMNKTITWTSANDAVATVDADGLVTAVSDGVVNITASSGGIAGTAEITVFTPSVLVLSNYDDGNAAIIDSFPVYQAHFTIDTMNVAGQTPGVALLRQYDVVLLYEDGLFANSPNVGDSVAAYYQAGGNVVIGTFYWQDRSDNTEYASRHGWGALETSDPFTAPEGAEYRPDHLDTSSIVAHPIMAGVDSLYVDDYHGGVAAKTGTTVLARWSDMCTNCTAAENDPLVGYLTGGNGQRMVGISAYPAYPLYGGFSGDFYRLWGNALRWAAKGGPGPATTSAAATVWAAPQPASAASGVITGGSRRGGR